MEKQFDELIAKLKPEAAMLLTAPQAETDIIERSAIELSSNMRTNVEKNRVIIKTTGPTQVGAILQELMKGMQAEIQVEGKEKK